MLAQIALIVFALCGLLSLVIDIGYARLSQGQMQNAADAAALEGLRKRDVGLQNPVTGQTINDPFASDCLRRAAANRIVRWTFDDDFDPAGGDEAYQFGAGPVVDLTEGVTSVHALQTISVPDPHVYKPDPQLNQRNQVYGDMVSGRFCYTADPVPSEGGAYELQDIVCTEPQRGSGSYARNDFNPNLTSPGPPPGLTACPAPDAAVPSPWPLPGSGSISGVDDSALPTVSIVVRSATNRPTTAPVAHVGAPAPVRVMTPVAGLIATVMATAAPFGAWTQASANANRVTPGWTGLA